MCAYVKINNSSHLIVPTNFEKKNGCDNKNFKKKKTLMKELMYIQRETYLLFTAIISTKPV